MLEESFSNRLEQAMNLRDIKASELSKIAKVPKSAISQYLSGLFEPKQKTIFKLSKALNVSESWLMGLDVPMNKNIKLDNLGNPVKDVPLLGVVKAGYDYLAQENWIGTVEVDKKLADSGEVFALKVKRSINVSCFNRR